MTLGISSIATKAAQYLVHSLLFGADSRVASAFSFNGEVVDINITKGVQDLETIQELPVGTLCRVVLPSSHTLTHQFRVPRASTRDLRQMATLEAERIFPVQIDRLMIACSFDKNGSENSVLVRIAAVRKSLMRKLESLASAQGLQLQGAILADQQNASPMHIQIETAKTAGRVRLAAVSALLLCFCLILSMFPSAYHGRIEQKLAEINQSIVETRRSTSGIANLQRQITQMHSLASQVYAENNRGNIVDVLVTLAEASPDDIVIDELRVERSNLYIVGRAETPEQWLISLGQNNALRNAALTTISQNSASGKQRFELRANIVWPSEREEVS